MKYLIAIVLATSGMVAHAACPDDLYNKWTLKSQSTTLDSGLVKESMPMTYNFTKDNKVNIAVPPIFDVTSPIVCNDNVITINKTVPVDLTIIRLGGSELVWKEKGAGKYFYLGK